MVTAPFINQELGHNSSKICGVSPAELNTVGRLNVEEANRRDRKSSNDASVDDFSKSLNFFGASAAAIQDSRLFMQLAFILQRLISHSVPTLLHRSVYLCRPPGLFAFSAGIFSPLFQLNPPSPVTRVRWGWVGGLGCWELKEKMKE